MQVDLPILSDNSCESFSKENFNPVKADTQICARIDDGNKGV